MNSRGTDVEVQAVLGAARGIGAVPAEIRLQARRGRGAFQRNDPSGGLA
jgi:hypothetical protein